MEIVERREYGGHWWGRDPQGSWHRWNAASNGWEGPLEPPWPPAEPPHPDEEAIVARALAATGAGTDSAGGAGDPPPMNPIDTWWNRQFPPYSVRRLVFGLVTLPLIGALVELLWVLGGRGASLPRYLFVCVAGGALLATAWLPGMREVAERMRATGAFDTRSPWPWRRRRDAPPAPPLPPLAETFGRDVRMALPFCAAIVLVMSATVGGIDETLSPAGLLTTAVASVLAAVMVALRTSIWGLVAFSVAGGLLGGVAMVLLSLMSWSNPRGTEFLIGWGFGTLWLFVFAYPLWRGLRDLEARGFRLPMWIVMGGSVLMVSGAALVFLAERS